MYVTWLRNDASIPETDRDHVRLEPWSLMVRNFTAPRGEKIVYYKCILVGLEYHSKELERSFNLTLEEGMYCGVGVAELIQFNIYPTSVQE